MRLVLVRHAPAEPRRPGQDDARRALTVAGRARLALTVAALARLGEHGDLLLTSPWRRALDTAEALAELVDGPVHVAGELAAPPGPALVERLRAAHAAGHERIVLVGHEPWLGECATWLVAGWRASTPATDSAPGGIVLAKGGVVVLQGGVEPGRWTLRAALPPEVLRRLAR